MLGFESCSCVIMTDSKGLEREIEELKLKEEKGNVHDQAQGQLQITTFSELVNDVNLHFQIIHFPKQVFLSSNSLHVSTHSIYEKSKSK